MSSKRRDSFTDGQSDGFTNEQFDRLPPGGPTVYRREDFADERHGGFNDAESDGCTADVNSASASTVQVMAVSISRFAAGVSTVGRHSKATTGVKTVQ